MYVISMLLLIAVLAFGVFAGAKKFRTHYLTHGKLVKSEKIDIERLLKVYNRYFWKEEIGDMTFELVTRIQIPNQTFFMLTSAMSISKSTVISGLGNSVTIAIDRGRGVTFTITPEGDGLWRIGLDRYWYSAGLNTLRSIQEEFDVEAK